MRLKTKLGAQRHDPLVLKQFNGAGTLVRIAVEAFHQEIDALLTELVAGGKLWRIALRYVVHDGPLVIHGCPWATTCCHFENNTTQ